MKKRKDIRRCVARTTNTLACVSRVCDNLYKKSENSSGRWQAALLRSQTVHFWHLVSFDRLTVLYVTSRRRRLKEKIIKRNLKAKEKK